MGQVKTQIEAFLVNPTQPNNFFKNPSNPNKSFLINMVNFLSNTYKHFWIKNEKELDPNLTRAKFC